MVDAGREPAPSTNSLQSSWLRVRDGATLYADSAEHVALLVRTLGITELAWASVLDRYAALADATLSVPRKLALLADAYRPAMVQAVPLPAVPALTCPACLQSILQPLLARTSGAVGAVPLVYGRCAACGHGSLIHGGAVPSVYEQERYFERRGPDGVGYEAYENERAYRESKGARLLERIERELPPVVGAGARTSVEVGSGFGFTRAAAILRGWRAEGVDPNPAAARAAQRLYGLDTTTATLAEALASGAVPAAGADLVLYQFVLEHIADPGRELEHARAALKPGGLVVFVVPNMASFEVAVFGASYRSFRADHPHLFSVASARAYLARAGLAWVAHESVCSLNLLEGFMSTQALAELYAQDLGPDLIVMARRAS